MIEPTFDHDRLDVYRLAIECTSDAFAVSRNLKGLHRHARDQWLCAAQSIPLNIAEGNGKRSLKDRARVFDIARGSSFECAAIQGVLVASGGIEHSTCSRLKTKLKRIVSMLTKMATKFDGVSEPPVGYAVDVDYEHEHRDAEHEHDGDGKPEPSVARAGTESASIVNTISFAVPR